jgi:hypothetical protein
LARSNAEGDTNAGVNDETDTIDAAIPSTDEEMMIALEEIPITPQLVTTSGNITIDIPDYNPAEGRLP